MHAGSSDVSMEYAEAYKAASEDPSLMDVDLHHEGQPDLPMTIARAYQQEILEEALVRNVIAVLPTGVGKTLIGAMLISRMVERLASTRDKKLAVFLVPSVPLVYQQAEFVRNETQLNVKNFTGDMGVDFWCREEWLKELDLETTDVVVCTPQIFYNCLAHAYLSMDQCSLLIIDECHHARKKHPVNTMLMHFYHPIAQGASRPKILGLTASPIWNPINPLKSLEDLESNLQASIIAVKSNLEELDFHSSKPKEIVEFYTQIMDPAPSTLFRKLVQIGFVGTIDTPWKTVQAKANASLSVLGQLGMDQFLVQLYKKSIDTQVRSAAYKIGFDPEELVVFEKAQKALDKAENAFPENLVVDDLPQKVGRLVEILSKHRLAALANPEDDIGFQCIIFVIQRHVAFGLTWMLERIESLRSWLKIRTLVGHGGKETVEGQSQDFKQQQQTVKDFKSGYFNVLVSTAVGEEGLDFPACDLVIRFDALQTMIGYVQSRGRARHQKSKFVLMLNQSSEIEMQNYQRFLASEPALNEVYREDRGEVGGYDMESAQISRYDLALRERFDVPDTGATLTYEGAVQLVEQTCSLLPHAMGVPPPRPTYIPTTTTADGNPCYFIADIQLPTAVPLPADKLYFKGTARTSKSEAKRAVAFKAAKVLWKYKLLNNWLLPHRESQGNNAEDGNGRQLGEDLPYDVDIEFRSTWGNIWNDEFELFLHPIAVDGQKMLGIIAGRKVLVNKEPFILWQGRDKDEHQVQIRTYPAQYLKPPAGTTKLELREMLYRYTNTVMTRCIRPNYQLTDKMACMFAPLTPEGTIDYSLLGALSDDAPRPKWSNDAAAKFLAFDSMGRHIRIECIRSDLTPQSTPVEIEQPTGVILCREAEFESYEAYAEKKLCYMERTDVLLQSPDDTMLQVLSLRRRRNNLVSQYDAIQPAGIHGRTKGHPQGERFIIPRKLVRLSTIPLIMRDVLLLIPSIMRCMTDFDRIRNTSHGLDLSNVELGRLHEALSPPAASYGHDYQRLETLGDRVLQLATTVYLYQEFPHKHEGLLSPLRANSVCNRFLRGRAFEAGLGARMCMESVMIARWSPPYASEIDPETGKIKKQVKRKWLQDCLEALLGAAYLSGGWPLALKIGDAVGLCFGGTLPWEERRDALPPQMGQRVGQNLEELEKKLDYSFNYPQLLLSAVTHPSYCGLETSPYQRLEFLGDAVLDFVIMNQLFKAFPKEDSGGLSWLKMVFVNNASLGFLSVRMLQLHSHLLHESAVLTQTILTNVTEIEAIDLNKMLEEIWDYHPPKLFADILEAICGAIFIDCGYDVEVVTRILGPILEPFFKSLEHAQRIDPISVLIRWAVRVYKCQQIRFIRVDPVEGEAIARHWYAVAVHDQIISKAGADHAHNAKCRGSQLAFEILREEGVMEGLCNCRPAGTDIDEDGVHGDFTADEMLRQEELEKVFEIANADG